MPPAVVEHFEGMVRGAESDISDILKQERTEKELRLAEMEANKASNLMKHAAAIAARPARTWCAAPASAAWLPLLCTLGHLVLKNLLASVASPLTPDLRSLCALLCFALCSSSARVLPCLRPCVNP